MRHVVLAVALFLCAVELCLGEVRTWSDSSGFFTLKAEYLKRDGDDVQLRKDDGSEVSLPIEKLSVADRNFIIAADAAAKSKQSNVSQQVGAKEKSGKSSPLPDPGAGKLATLIEKVEPAVVIIETNFTRGSGAVISDEGLIVSSLHLFRDAERVQAVFKSGKRLPIVGYVAVSPGEDLIVLKASTDEKLPFLPIAAKLPKKGENVAAFGAPKGFLFSVTPGIVGSVRKGADLWEIVGDVLLGLGFSMDSVWIQTSARFSPGNCGGPLVNMDGEIVGVNAWRHADGDGLNFAAFAGQIQPLIKTASKKPILFSAKNPVFVGGDQQRQAGIQNKGVQAPVAPPIGGLVGAKPPVDPAEEDDNAASLPVYIKLPSGMVVDEEDLELPFDWQTRFFPDNNVFVKKYSGADAIAGIFTVENSRLNGCAATLYEDGDLKSAAFYNNALKHGTLRYWEEKHVRVLFANYKSGKKDGVLCFFERGVPRLVQEWKRDKLSAEYIVNVANGAFVVGKSDSLSGSDRKAFDKSKNELARVEALIAENEQMIKREMAPLSRKAEEQDKRERGAKVTKNIRDGMLDRVDYHNAVKSEDAQNQWRQTLQSAVKYQTNILRPVKAKDLQ